MGGSIYLPDEDEFRLGLPLQTIEDREHGTITIEQGEGLMSWRGVLMSSVVRGRDDERTGQGRSGGEAGQRGAATGLEHRGSRQPSDDRGRRHGFRPWFCCLPGSWASAG